MGSEGVEGNFRGWMVDGRRLRKMHLLPQSIA